MTLKTGRALGFAAFLLLGSFACSAQNDVGVDDGKGDTESTSGDDYIEAWGVGGDATLGQLAVATESAAGPVTLLDAHDGAQLRVLKPTAPTPPYSGIMAMREAGGVIAVSDLYTTWIFKADGTQLHAIPGAAVGGLSQDGKTLVSGGAGGVRRFDAASGAELLPTLEAPPPNDGGVEPAFYVAISPDGALVAASSSTAVSVWRTIDGTRLFQIESYGSHVALSATELAVASTFAVTVYSLAGAMLSQYPLDGQSSFQHVAFSADGTKLAYTTRLSSGPWVGATLIKIIDRLSGAEAANLFEDRQALTQSNGKGVGWRGLAFVGDTIAVVWSDRRVTLFGAADGVPIWSRILDE